MARRRFAGRRGPSPTRMLEWSATVASGFTNVAAGVTSQVVLFNNSGTVQTGKHTIYRIVGTMTLLTQADTGGFFHLGVYKSNLSATGGNVSLEPDQLAAVESDQWMWWTARATDVNAGERGFQSGLYTVDIKVKRTLDEEQAIHLGMVCNVAYKHYVNLRILSKITGTR